MRKGILFRPRARDDLDSHALWTGRESEEEAQAFMDAVRTGCLERDVSYELARTDVPWDRTLTAHLARRSRMS